ncbi:MAG: peptide chain release factor 1 [Candidatus Andersenbacteria bacterium]
MNYPSIEKLRVDINQLTATMSEPDVMKSGSKMKELARELNHKRELADTIERLKLIEEQQAEVALMLESDDQEMMALAIEEQTRLASEHASLEKKLQSLLVPVDPLNSRDVIVEIRAGAGGEEAALFAGELFRAYARYAELQGWKTTVMSQSFSEQGGFKEVVAEVSGEQVFGTMKYERGVHRVQRVPETEKMGRIHTSTITVAILPQAEEVDIEIRPEDLRIDTYRASGAGGQHVNKTSSAIRITHIPTGVVVACQEERSQHKNKTKAMGLLRARLLDAQEERRAKAQAQERRGQIGTGDRSEKIRTYNFPQDRITDHRIKQSWSNIGIVMEGNLGPMFEALKEAEQRLLLEQTPS